MNSETGKGLFGPSPFRSFKLNFLALTERHDLRLGLVGFDAGDDVENRALAVVVDAAALDGYLGGNGDPVEVVERIDAGPAACEASVDDICGAAGHDVPSDDKHVGGKLACLGDKTGEFDRLALVLFFLAVTVGVPDAVVVIGDFDDRSVHVERERVLNRVGLHAAVVVVDEDRKSVVGKEKRKTNISRT